MDSVLKFSNDELASYYQEAASRSNFIKEPIILEKDWWVCWTLKQVFSIPEIKDHITFKGGTSLSKCYSIINRFSEDCDITIDKAFLGFHENFESILGKGRNQKDKSLSLLAGAAKKCVQDVIKPLFIAKLKQMLVGKNHGESWKVELDPSDADNQTILFYYPSAFKKDETRYIRTVIKLEFGARGDIIPNE